ncbi:hypothetical protein [Streptomyces finlayi]|uniref:hypothetical protein n=1 Tax=Streptomyces finlayi TaxID=67296 RepID=UPI001674624D|nr:hypothetical protein [Streptomyces finlayi]
MIPLQPLAVSDVLGGTFSAFGRHWKPLIGIAALVHGAALLLVGGAAALAFWGHVDTFHALERAGRNDSPVGSEVTTLAVSFGLVAVLGAVCLLFATAVSHAASTVALQEAVLGRPTTFRGVWRRAVRRVPAVAGTLLIPALSLLVLMALFLTGYIALMLAYVEDVGGSAANWLAAVGVLGALLFVPVAVWLWVSFAFAPAIAVFESAGPMQALRRSARLVKGSWWRIFGISLLVYVMAWMASWLIQIPFSVLSIFSLIPSMAAVAPNAGEELTAVQVILSMSGYLLITLLGSFVSQIVVIFFPQLATGLLYVDQRIRRENLAPSLAEAAFGPPPPQH